MNTSQAERLALAGAISAPRPDPDCRDCDGLGLVQEPATGDLEPCECREPCAGHGRHDFALYDPQAEDNPFWRLNVRNLSRLSRAACAHCRTEADPQTVNRLQRELGETFAEAYL